MTAKTPFSVKTFLLFLVPAALFATFFYRPLIENERFAYRDAGYFYYPLFEQIQREWERGRLPLWDPYENLGQPLAGNPTSSVFYPGKAIFFLSSAGCADFNACFSLYICVHVALCFFGVYFLTRRLGTSRVASILAGTSYAFSGPILFQYSNVIFLVGAAWLPFFALFSFDFFASPTLGGKLKSTLKLSVAQALAILGGEPQIVYLSTFAFISFALIAPVRLAVPSARSRQPFSSPAPSAARVFFPVRDRLRVRLALGLLLFVGASSATALLAAPQILPSSELIARSGRAAAGPPRSLWEIPAALRRTSQNKQATQNSETTQDRKATQNSETTQNRKATQNSEAPQNSETTQNRKATQNSETTQDRKAPQNSETAQNQKATQNAQTQEPDFYSSLLCRDIENNGRSRATYRFSVGPWRWAERLFPNVGGRQFPRSSRWFAIFPEEISVWAPTLYCGVVPYLLALSAARFGFRLRRSRRQNPQNQRRRFFRQNPTARFRSHSGANASSSRSSANAPTREIVKLFPVYRRERSTVAAFRVWATWLVLFSTTAALGGFGLVWAFRFCDALVNGAQPASTFVDGDPVGGLYWFLNLTAPKFVEFRYPAKLLTLSALGLAVLTAFGWDERRFSRRFFILGAFICAISTAAFLAVSACGDALFADLRAIDPLHGPVQPRLAFKSLRDAFGQTALVLAATLLLLALEKRFNQPKPNTRAKNKGDAQKSTSSNGKPRRVAAVSLAVLTISALDLYVANAWTIATAPRPLFEKRSEISQIVEEERAARILARLADSPRFTQTDAAPRFARLPQSHSSLRSPASDFDAKSALSSNLTRSSQLDADLADAPARFSENDQIKGLSKLPEPERLRALAQLDAPPIRIYRFPVWFPAAFPTASSSARTSERVVWDAATLFPKYPFSREIATIDARGTATEAEYSAFIDAFPLGRDRDADAAFLDVAFFLGPPELTARLAANAANSTQSREFAATNASLRRVQTPSSRVWIFRDDRPAPRPGERAEIVFYEPNRIAYFVALDAPARLVFAEQYWPDWNGRFYPLDADAAASLLQARFDADAVDAFLRTRFPNDATSAAAPFDAPLEPTFRFLRQTSAPAGTYCFIATYQPRRLAVGAAIGTVAWGSLLAAATVAFRRRFRRRR